MPPQLSVVLPGWERSMRGEPFGKRVIRALAGERSPRAHPAQEHFGKRVIRALSGPADSIGPVTSSRRRYPPIQVTKRGRVMRSIVAAAAVVISAAGATVALRNQRDHWQHCCEASATPSPSPQRLGPILASWRTSDVGPIGLLGIIAVILVVGTSISAVRLIEARRRELNDGNEK